MDTRKMKLALSAGALALSLALAGCGGSSSGPTAANNTPDPDPPPPMPVAAMGSLMLSAAQQAALRSYFPEDADETRKIEIPKGMSVTRGGVIFTCNGDYDCTVMLRNELDAIVATWESMQVEGGMMAGVMAMLPANLDVFMAMNTPSAASVKALILGGFGTNAAATDHDNDTPIVGDNGDAAIGGLGLGNKGPMSFSDVSLRGPFDGNGPAYTTDDVITLVTTETLGESRTAAAGGSVLSAKDNGLTTNADKVMLASWHHRALFSDWGDTHSPDRDGGFETGALVYSNMEAPMSHKWDGDLADKFVNMFDLPGIARAAGASNPYDFTVDRLDAKRMPGGTPDGTMDTVAFTVTTGTGITPGGMGSYVNANAAGAGSLQITVTGEATDGAFKAVTGRYLGVSGTYTCGTTTDCELSREMGADNFTLGDGNWQFTPMENAMVSVPDQDWLAFGAWATTPDDMMNGQHRVGVFYDGMNIYNRDHTTLTGDATYEGGAAGYYADGTEAGFFIADATLKADFGTESEAGMLTGRIDNFRDSAGMYLGDDTPSMPNDPDAGGENDWVVRLGTVTLSTDGSVMTGTTSGSADGVGWTGNWNARLYGPEGPDTSTDDNPRLMPSGIAGNFDATTGDMADNTVRAVTGAFGASYKKQ